jgi:hypothetical protein
MYLFFIFLSPADMVFIYLWLVRYLNPCKEALICQRELSDTAIPV